EIINGVQQSATDASEVLRVLALAGQLAPHAEVPNQFGAGYSSTVGLYTASLAAQTLRSQGKHREAFEWFRSHIEAFPVDHPLYWRAGHEMFELRIPHLKETGELLAMPPAARFPPASWSQRYGHKVTAYPDLKVETTPIFGGISTGKDTPLTQE